MMTGERPLSMFHVKHKRPIMLSYESLFSKQKSTAFAAPFYEVSYSTSTVSGLPASSSPR